MRGFLKSILRLGAQVAVAAARIWVARAPSLCPAIFARALIWPKRAFSALGDESDKIPETASFY